MVDCIQPFGRKSRRAKKVTWHFTAARGAFGHLWVVRACLSLISGLIKFGEAEAICTGWSVGG